MFQAIVYSARTGKRTVRDYDTRELAADSLAALLRVNGYEGERADIADELVKGRTLVLDRNLYWVAAAA